MSPAQEIARRRTFAIISHPDAGKTTLTEKFLLYGNALHLAGSVTARKNQRATASDWMELEKQRGISISSTVLQFDYAGCAVNLLDTPGHKDFSEDTYRVLTAVDAALMVIDAGKGVQAQTRKLFEVCRRRGVPIFTFMNKCDRPTLNAFALLDELESVLGLQCSPVIWPLGNGPTFKGVFDRRMKEVHLFERVPGGKYQAPVNVTSLDDDVVRSHLIPSSPMDTASREKFTNYVKSNLRAVEGFGHVQFRIEGTRLASESAFVTTCTYDTLVIFDVADPANPADDIVYNDGKASFRARWELRQQAGKWLIFTGETLDKLSGGDLCEF